MSIFWRSFWYGFSHPWVLFTGPVERERVSRWLVKGAR